MGVAEDLHARALAWRRAQVAAVCDVLAPWEHGLVARATRAPGYYDYNALIVSRPTGLAAGELAAVADEKLAGLGHRRIEFEGENEAARLAPAFAQRDWRTFRLVMMRFAGATPTAGPVEVAQVDYDAVDALRRAWHEEDFPGTDTSYMQDARTASLARGPRVLAASDGDQPIGFAQVEQAGSGIEIADVFVLPEHRGRGVGTSVTAAALRWAVDQGAEDIWIVADADGRPRHLYARLGFVPVRTWGEFLLVL